MTTDANGLNGRGSVGSRSLRETSVRVAAPFHSCIRCTFVDATFRLFVRDSLSHIRSSASPHAIRWKCPFNPMLSVVILWRERSGER